MTPAQSARQRAIARENMAREIAGELGVMANRSKIAVEMTRRTGRPHTVGMVMGLLDRGTKRRMREKAKAA